MNVATLARAWLDQHDFSTFPPSGDGSYALLGKNQILKVSLLCTILKVLLAFRGFRAI